MPTKNQAFINALNAAAPSRPNLIQGLNALLMAKTELANINDFRQAIIGHNVVWHNLGGFLYNGENNTDADLLSYNGSTQGNGVPPNDANNVKSIKKLAATKRAFFTLKDADEGQLIAIINQDPTNETAFRQKFFNDEGTSLFGVSEVTITEWDPAQNTILDNVQFPALKEEAQRQLLIKKINACNDKAKLVALLNSSDQLTFQNAVKNVFGLTAASPAEEVALADGMQFNVIMTGANNLIKASLAKKGFSLEIAAMKKEDILLTLGLNTLNEVNLNTFRGYFNSPPLAAASAFAPQLSDNDVNAIKGKLGARFLALKAAELGVDRIAEIERIASEADRATIIGLLRAEPALTTGGTGKYIKHAVTEESLPHIRLAFATQALRVRITQCDDIATLDALMKMADVAGLKRELEDKISLGYKGNAAFQAAFSDQSNIKHVIASAHIQKNLSLEAKPEYLRGLLGIDPTDATPPGFEVRFKDEYAKSYSQKTPQSVKAAITDYFADRKNIDHARQRALVAYAKAKLSTLSDADLKGLFKAADPVAVQAKMQLLCGASTADLLTLHDTGFALELRNLAAVERVIKDSKVSRQDLSNPGGNADHTALLANINNLTFNNGLHNTARGLIVAPGFPVKEKQRIQAHLVESLVRNCHITRIPAVVPPALDILTELVQETDKDTFKTILNTKFGVIDTNWVNEKTMEQVKKGACTRLIELDRGNHLQFGGESRPKLMALIANLPLEKQQALLKNPKALTALAAAQDKAEVERVLGKEGLVTDAIIKAAVDENKNLIDIAKIANSEVAKILAKMEIPVSADNVGAINRLLLTQPFTPLDATVHATRGPLTRYQAAIHDIARIINPQPDSQNLYQAFGLDNGGVPVLGAPPNTAAKMDPINTQHTRNQSLIAWQAVRGKTTEEKTIVLSLLALNKSNTPLVQIDEIVANIKTKTFAEFKAIIKGPPVKLYNAAFDPPLDQQLTPHLYEQMKTGARKQAFLNPAHYEATLDTQKTELDAIEDAFESLQLEPDELDKLIKLKNLAQTQAIYWFNPAFQGGAKQKAAVMGPELREFSKLADARITYLNNQLHAFDVQYNSLPTAEDINKARLSGPEKREMTQAINDRIVELKALHKKVNKELRKLKALQLVFKGDHEADNPMLRQGLLKTLEQAEAGKHDIKLSGFTSYSIDHDLSKRSECLARDATTLVNPNPEENSISVGGTRDNFEAVDAIPAGHFREHIVNCPTEVAGRDKTGTFIEERSASNLEPKVETGGVVKYLPTLKLTAGTIPDSNEAKVHLAMAMASKLVATLSRPPTADNPITIKASKDPEFAKFLWTALMVIGERDPGMKFGIDQINVISARFNPSSQLSFAGRFWASDSVYKNYFEGALKNSAMLKGIDEVNKKKFDVESRKALLETREDTAEITTKFKLFNQKIVAENTKQEEETRATLDSSGSPGPRMS